MHRLNQNRLISLIIAGGVACLTLMWCRSPDTFNFRAYKTSGEVRAALLDTLPIGSEPEDVFAFFEENHIPSGKTQRHGYSPYYEDRDIIRLTMPARYIWNTEWFITFKFNEDKKLEDIEVEAYMTFL